jgi:hypothetical protein
MGLEEIGLESVVNDPAQNRDKWRTHECVKDVSVSHIMRGDGYFLTGRGNITISRMTLLRSVNSLVVLRGHLRNFLHCVETSCSLSC